MKKETYATAVQLQEKVSQIQYDIKLLKEELQSNNVLIRFGGHFNVSAPISIEQNTLLDFILEVIKQKEEELEELQEKFNNL